MDNHNCWYCGGGLLVPYFVDGSNPHWLVCIGCQATTCKNPTTMKAGGYFDDFRVREIVLPNYISEVEEDE